MRSARSHPHAREDPDGRLQLDGDADAAGAAESDDEGFTRLNLQAIEKDLSVIQTEDVQDLWHAATKREPYFLTWVKMGPMSGVNSPYLLSQPKKRETDS